MKEHNKLLITLIAFILLLVTGVIGYSLLLETSLIDSLYMTVITISTVGYKEVAEMSDAAKLFSIFIIFSGLGFAGYLFTSLVSFFIDGDIFDTLRKRELMNRMKNLSDHYVICGAGETGESIIRQFERSSATFIVIDNDEERVEELTDRGIMAMHGDATHEEDLIHAGIQRARGLISSLSSDADNVFTVLTSRYLNQDLYIIARAIEDHAHEKLTRAGADRTISPNEIGGRRMAALMLRPTIISFLDMITHVGEVVLDLEDVVIFKGSSLAGIELKDAKIPEKTGLIVLAIQKTRSMRMLFNPGPDEILEIGDSMIVLGTQEQVEPLRKLALDNGTRECV